MDALDEEIARLEAVIKGYEAEYATALPEDKRQLRDLITACSQNLTELEKRKNAAAAGMRS
jgi:phage shock protein A